MARYQRARDAGFAFSGAPPVARGFTPKPGSHDDGPLCGPFLGGIGAPAFARDLHGRFDRWHMEPGVHARQEIASCFLAVSWEADGQRQGRTLAIGSDGFAAADRDYATLFPLSYELYRGLPFALLLEIYSPTIPHDLASAELPVAMFNIYLDAVSPGVSGISLALFWTNLLGWSQFAQSSEHRAGRLWPGHTNAGNHSAPVDIPGAHGIAFRRAPTEAETVWTRAETVIAVQADGAPSRELCFMADVATTGEADRDQRFTVAHVGDAFVRTGRLPAEDLSWRAHWHEPQGGAVATALTPGGGSRATFVVVHDWPVCAFGAGRRWRRGYADAHGADGRNGAALAALALDRNAGWLDDIARWQQAALTDFTGADVPLQVAGAALNELSFVIGGGSCWVTAEADPADPDLAFRDHRHFGILEGFDTGYYYYNTADLWVYAFAAIGLHWPALADSVFDDYLDTIAPAVRRDRPTYRHGTVAPMLLAGKIPHDMGSPADDPWVRLNGYALRDDPNLWKDHNPAFILSYLLHAHLHQRSVPRDTYARLKCCADFVADQIKGTGGIPEHDAFGDSTWDNLQMRGISAYAGGLCTAMWHAMARLAAALGEADDAARYAKLGAAAHETLGRLWNGDYFLANDKGKYSQAIMADALLGLHYARLMGLGDLVDPNRVRCHLLAVYRTNFQGYAAGSFGPLLVAEPGRDGFEQDGGQSLQVNEVLVGAAWMYVAMLRDHGLKAEADRVSTALREVVYERGGLQFRTPAAFDADGRFRAPLNLRPLAIWMTRLRSPHAANGSSA